MRPRAATAAALVAVALLGLVARFVWSGPRGGPDLQPRPDSLEYVASAQAIARDGIYVLQLGPQRVPPRYPPGWPLALAAALRAGVPAAELWRVTALLDLAGLLGVAALAAAFAGRTLGRAGAGERARALGAAGAALLAGGVLAVVSGRVRLAGTVLSEPAAFASAFGALLLAACALFGGGGATRRRGTALLAGLLGAAAIAIRPLDGLAAAAAGIVLAAAAVRRRGARPAAAGLGWLALGAFLFALGTGALLVRSGRAPWDWTAYDFWIERYGSVSDWWQPRIAFDRSQREDGSLRMSGLRYAVRALSDRMDREPGLVPGLPFAALALLGVLAVLRERREGAAVPAGERALALALAAWFAVHTLAYASYYYRLPRFFGAPAALLVLAGAWGAGVAIAGRSRGRRAAALALVAFTIAATAIDAVRPRPPARRPAVRRPLAQRVEASVEAWRKLPPRQRRRAAVMPFDPLEAQAFGVLRASDAERFPWGELPPTEHTDRLAGRARRQKAAASGAVDSVDTPRSGP